MKNLRNIEVFNIETKADGLYAHISFQDITKVGDINNGYGSICVPVKPRLIQTSGRNNMLVNQSVRIEVEPCINQ